MKRWLAILGLLAIGGIVAPLLVAWNTREPAPETGDLLAVGQTYVFTGDPTIIGEVLERPRDKWVKVRIVNKSRIPAKATWVNLSNVKAISVVEPTDVKD